MFTLAGDCISGYDWAHNPTYSWGKPYKQISKSHGPPSTMQNPR